MASGSGAKACEDKELELGADFCGDVPNAETLEVLEDVCNGRNLVGPFYTVEELMESLNADD